MARIVLDDGSGWIDLEHCKRYAGKGSDLYRSLGGSWVLETVGSGGVAHYQRISLEEAHAWLVRHAFYPGLSRDFLTAL